MKPQAPVEPAADARGTPREALEDLGSRYGLESPTVERLAAIAERLADDARAPTAVQGRQEVLERHIADSLAGLDVPQLRQAARIADIGSGAGLPGVVLAAALPTAEVRSVESQQSKCAYVASLVATARIANVRVVRARAEEWAAGLGEHDAVVARALAAQPVVLEYAAPLLAPGGHLVEWRGGRDGEQEAAGARAAERLGLTPVEVRAVTPFAGAERRHLHVFVKSSPTPGEFPRRAGVAAKRPLGV